jgi:hypothetical protein
MASSALVLHASVATGNDEDSDWLPGSAPDLVTNFLSSSVPLSYLILTRPSIFGCVWIVIVETTSQTHTHLS